MLVILTELIPELRKRESKREQTTERERKEREERAREREAREREARQCSCTVHTLGYPELLVFRPVAPRHTMPDYKVKEAEASCLQTSPCP